MSRGKLIIIDGTDGSGKSVQGKLLIKYLHSINLTSKYMDFPQYNTFYGKIVAQFLRGEFGSIDQVSPYLASLPYAMDRLSVKDQINTFLENGIYVIANRYATSNMAHQGAKFSDESQRDKYLSWVQELEYEVNGIPKEDIMLYLHVPHTISDQLIETRKKKEYLDGKDHDIHEKDKNYQKKVEELYVHLVKSNPHWVDINCCEEDQLMSKDAIHEKVKQALQNKGIV